MGARKAKHGWPLTIFFTIVSLLYVYPIVLVFINSFKKKAYISKSPFQIPTGNMFVGLENYIREAVVPEMQRKLRQGFGRAIRTETDVCAVSILDRRACPGGRYHQAVLDALPECPVTHSVGEIEAFLRLKKGPEYFREERSWKNKNETYAMKSSITQPILI